MTRPLAVIPHTFDRPGIKRVVVVLDDAFGSPASIDFFAGTLPRLVADAVSIPASDTVEAIVKTAQQCEADLIIAGVSALSDVTGVRLGGRGIDLVDDADRPVILVPPGV